MSDSYSIEAPVTLFTLPQPSNSSSKGQQAGPSHSISGSRKRKRTEIVVGSDGETVNVYDVKAPRLAISHAIPPQARLTAPPCSVYTKTSAPKSSTRYTYAALHNDLRAKKQQVICWVQTSPASPQATSAGSELSQHTWEQGKKASPVVHLDVVPAAESHEVIVVHADGHIRGLSRNLQQELWSTSVGTDISVRHAFVQSAQEARSGLLKHREDLLATVATAAESQDTAVISVISQGKDGKLVLHIFAVQPLLVGSTATLSDRARLLIQWGLPETQGVNQQSAHFSFDRNSGTLYHVSRQALIAYTFTTLGARVSHTISQPSPAPAAFLPLPRSLALLATPKECTLMNTHYSSVLAVQSLSSDEALRSGKKRKHGAIAGPPVQDTAPIVLLDYFRTLNLALAIQHNTLIAIQLRSPTALLGRAKKASFAGSRLIESLGRGVPSKGKDVTHAPAAIDGAKVDELARNDPTLAKLARLFTHHKKNKAPYVALEGLVQSLKWVLRSFTTPALEPQPRLPSSASEDSPNKKPKLNGISSASSSQPTDSTTAPDPLEDALLAEAAAADADLSLAVALITSSTHNLTNSTKPNDSDNKHADNTTSSTDTTLNARAATLQTLLTRLGTSQPRTLLASSFRSQLSRHDLFLLIELLRHALEQGGWTTKTLDVYPSSSDDEAEADAGGLDSSIKVIGTLLSCAVDALGAGAWLTGGVDVSVDETAYSSSSSSASDDDEDADMSMFDNNKRPLLPTLRHLTASVLEVTQEAAFFRAFLADFLRYADALAAAPQGVRNRLAGVSAGPSGANAVVLAGAGAVEGVGAGESMLPYGVRPARGIERTRVGAGGEVKARSRRDLADRLHREKGRYEFERIRI